LAASAEVGLSDRETFKSTLAATLIKEYRDHPTFDRLFNLYFLDLEALGEGLKKALGPEDPRVKDLLDQMLDEEGLELDDLTELLMRGEGSQMEMPSAPEARTPGSSGSCTSCRSASSRGASPTASTGRPSRAISSGS